MKILVLLLILLVETAFAGPTTRFIWLPSRFLDANASGPYNVLEMRCGGYVPAEGITGATQIVWYTSASVPGGQCAVAIYDSAGSLQKAVTPAIDCSSTGTKVVTGLAAFNLDPGEKYNVCTCGNAAMNGAAYIGWTPGVADAIARLLNGGGSGSGKVWRFAANPCDASGNPPATTGALTDTIYPPPVVLIGTNTP